MDYGSDLWAERSDCGFGGYVAKRYRVINRNLLRYRVMENFKIGEKHKELKLKNEYFQIFIISTVMGVVESVKVS